MAASAVAVEPGCPGSANPDPDVLFCEDYDSGAPLSDSFVEINSANGAFVRGAGVGIDGSYGMTVTYQPGQTSAGWMMHTFGRAPAGFYTPQSHGNQDFREVYWREYVRMAPGWSGAPHKLSRVYGIATGSWAQSMIAHVWNDGSSPYLFNEPASGIGTNNQLITTTFNDFANLRWLGGPNAIDPGWTGGGQGVHPVYASASADQWFCIEAHVKLNTPGLQDGVMEVWVDGESDAGYQGLNWVGTWQEYGINALLIENYWNGGAPGLLVRYRDNLVLSEQRIGCLGDPPPSIPAISWWGTPALGGLILLSGFFVTRPLPGRRPPDQ